MTLEQARKKLREDGLTYGDAVMLVTSAIPEGQSKVNPNLTQEQAKKIFLAVLEGWRKKYGSGYNLNRKSPMITMGVHILHEFGQ